MLTKNKFFTFFYFPKRINSISQNKKILLNKLIIYYSKAFKYFYISLNSLFSVV